MPPSTKESTVVIYSSARTQGNTAQQAKQYAATHGTETVFLDQYTIQNYRYDKQYSADDFYTLFEQLLEFDHWVLASPVYWYSTTSQMKSFIDRITDYMDDDSLQPQLRMLRAKRFSVLSNSIKEEAPDAFIDMFRQTFSYLGMEFVQHSHQQVA